MARDSARQAKEIELKLEFDPADAARLASHPALRAGPAPQEEHQLISTYFDTPDCALHKAGVYLRVRENDGNIVQTIKTAKSETDLIERLEWEREITSRGPDLDGVEDTPLKPLLTDGVRAALRPMFETQHPPPCLPHLAERLRHRGRDRSGRNRHQYRNAGHLRSWSSSSRAGRPRSCFASPVSLAATVPLRLEVKSKAERGYAMLDGGSLRVEKAAEIDIPPNMSAEEAFRAIARSCLRQIIANEPATVRRPRRGVASDAHRLAALARLHRYLCRCRRRRGQEEDQDRAQMDHAGAWSGARSRCVRRRGA